MITVWTVNALHKHLAGDPATEEAVLLFIRRKWGAKTLAHLPEKVANEILKRPGDFLARVKLEANHPFPQ